MSREDWDAGWKHSPVHHEPLADDDVPLYARPQGAVGKSALPQPSPDHREVMRLALEALKAPRDAGWNKTTTAAIVALRAALGEKA